MKKIALIFLSVVLCGLNLNAQEFDMSIETRYSDFGKYGKSKLVVEVLEEDKVVIAKLSGLKKDFPDAVQNYQAFVKSYNENLKKAIEKYWKLTDSVMYLTPKKIKQLKDSRERDVIVLSPKEIGGTENYITRLEGTAIQLVIYNIRKSVSEPDYKILLPYSFSRSGWNNPLTDYYYTINMATRNISHMIAKRTTSDCFDFMETEAMKNCKKQEKKKLLIDEVLVSPRAENKGIRKYYKRKKFKVIKRRDYEELENIILNGDAESSYLVLVPYSTLTNPFGREKKTYVLCYKVVVDASDGTVINYTKGKVKVSPDVSLLKEKDFKYLDECEF